MSAVHRVTRTSKHNPKDLQGNQVCENSIKFETQRPCTDQVPDHENCSLWITKLPQDVLRHLNEFFRPFHNQGMKVYSLVIRDPRPEEGRTGCAAYLTLRDRRSAERALGIIRRERLAVAGSLAQGCWNRYSQSPQSQLRWEAKNISRVLDIKSPSQVVNHKWLMQFLQERIVFQIEEIDTIHVPKASNGSRTHMRWVFGSWRKQAESALKALNTEYGHIITTEYGQDPCEYGKRVDRSE